MLTWYSDHHLTFLYLRRRFEVIWLLPRRLLCFGVIVVCSSVRGFVFRPRGFLGRRKDAVNAERYLLPEALLQAARGAKYKQKADEPVSSAPH